MRITSTRQFKEELEKVLDEEIPLSLWETITFVMVYNQIACHPPFDETDVELAVPKVKKLLDLYRRKNGTNL